MKRLALEIGLAAACVAGGSLYRKSGRGLLSDVLSSSKSSRPDLL
jgi:hypothetical protein